MQSYDFLNLSSTFGLIATGALTFNLLLGVLLSIKYRRTLLWNRLPRFARSVDIYQVHNYTAYLALLVAFLHPVLILFDKTAKFRVIDIVFPLVAAHQNYVYTLGALAFYCLLSVVITSTVVVRERITNRTWKWIHFATYAAAALFLIHGIWADPKLQDRPVNFVDAEKVLSEAGLVLLAGALILRLRYAKRKRDSETFHWLRVSKVITETATAKSFILEVPEKLKKQYKYRPGQFITVRVQQGDSFIKRSYSLSSSPDWDSFLQITIKGLGPISSYLLDTIKEGDELFVLPPEGSFFREPSKRRRHYVLFAAGSGITPIYSIIKTLLRAHPKSKLTLIYANRNQASIIFRKSLEMIEQQSPERFSVVHVLSQPEEEWKGRTARLAAPVIREIFREVQTETASAEYFVCGPIEFIGLVEAALLSQNVPSERIHAERFTFSPNVDVPVSEDSSNGVLEVGDPVEQGHRHAQKLIIQLEGVLREIDCRINESVLDAALRGGLNPPFACQEGVCASCKAALKEGRVMMRRHEALTPLEVDQRNILTCTAKPISEETVVSFDE